MKKQTRTILAQAAHHLVEAYKLAIAEYRQEALTVAVGVSEDSPETFEALWQQYQQGKITVTTANSSTAIYGRDGNVTFRVFHDLGHILYLKEFNAEDEVALAKRQWYDILKYIPKEWRKVCDVVYHADTVSQSVYEHAFGHFPEDQRAFVGAILENYLTQS